MVEVGSFDGAGGAVLDAEDVRVDVQPELASPEPFDDPISQVGVLRGNDGRDTLGGRGADVLRGGKSGDFLVGNTGADLLRGQSGDDDIYPHRGADVVFAGAGDDEVYVAPDNRPDTIDCGDGEDTVVGTYDATDFFVECEIVPMP